VFDPVFFVIKTVTSYLKFISPFFVDGLHSIEYENIFIINYNITAKY